MAYYWTDRSEVLQLYTEALSLTVDLSAVVQVEPAVAADIEAEQADTAVAYVDIPADTAAAEADIPADIAAASADSPADIAAALSDNR